MCMSRRLNLKDVLSVLPEKTVLSIPDEVSFEAAHYLVKHCIAERAGSKLVVRPWVSTYVRECGREAAERLLETRVVSIVMTRGMIDMARLLSARDNGGSLAGAVRRALADWLDRAVTSQDSTYQEQVKSELLKCLSELTHCREDSAKLTQRLHELEQKVQVLSTERYYLLNIKVYIRDLEAAIRKIETVLDDILDTVNSLLRQLGWCSQYDELRKNYERLIELASKLRQITKTLLNELHSLPS